MPELLQSSPFHPTLSNLLSQWIPRVFQNHPSTYAFDMVFCFLTLFHKPLLSSMFLLPLKTCSDFLHLKKKKNQQNLLYCCLPTKLQLFDFLHPQLPDSSISTISSSILKMFGLHNSKEPVLSNVYSGLLIINPKGFLKVLPYSNSLVDWILFTTTSLNRNSPFSWIT